MVTIAIIMTGCGQAAEEGDKDRASDAGQQTQETSAADQPEAVSKKIPRNRRK